MVKADFHSHSNCSDGLLSPTEMVQLAAKNNVKYYSLTDHDTISGLDEAITEAKLHDIKFIPGIELSTNFNNESIHILGFFKDDSYKNKEFIAFLNDIKNNRLIRAKKMVEKLNEHFNIEISYEKLLKRGKDVVARPHIAQEIIAEKYPYTKDEIFDKFIGKNCKAYVETTKITPEEGIRTLHKFNALAFLAHPVLINNSSLNDFLNIGLDGIEAIYYQNSKEQEKSLIDFANKNNLLISAGSDCHGDFENDKRHGIVGDMLIENNYLENFLEKIRSCSG
ncbi:MAG: PHP domain-containing protein [Clostridiales bacterium]|nr:PHP domain-containing protein [Clostridiales bacterium]